MPRGGEAGKPPFHGLRSDLPGTPCSLVYNDALRTHPLCGLSVRKSRVGEAGKPPFHGLRSVPLVPLFPGLKGRGCR